MNLVSVADAIAWSALMLFLTAAAALSVLAFLRPRTAYLWFAGGSLAVALLAAAAISEPSERVGFGPLVTILAFTAAVFGGGPAASTALNVAMRGTVAPGLHGGIIVADRLTPEQQRQGVVAGARHEVLRGGGVAPPPVAKQNGFPEGLAIVVAVKGVGRFTELEAPEARERFIIGTFASLIWACAAALVVHLALR